MFYYAQIIPTKTEKYDIVSVFQYFPKNNSIEECDRTMYDSLRWYKRSAKNANEEYMTFGTYLAEEGTLVFCKTINYCTLNYKLGAKRRLIYLTNSMRIKLNIKAGTVQLPE